MAEMYTAMEFVTLMQFKNCLGGGLDAVASSDATSVARLPD